MADFIIPKGKDFSFSVDVKENDSFLAQDLTNMDTVTNPPVLRVFDIVTNSCAFETELSVPADVITDVVPEILATAHVKDITIANVTPDTSYNMVLNGTYYSYVSDASVAQLDKLSTFTLEQDTTYSLTIDGTAISYTSDPATAQIDLINTITVDNEAEYAITVNGAVATYTSDVNATIEEITLGMVGAINALSEPVTATDGVGEITIISDIPGTPFTTNITVGTMEVTTNVYNTIATLEEVTLGLTNAINASVAPVTAINGVGFLTILADIKGSPINTVVTGGTMTASTVIASNSTDIDEIAAGLTSALGSSIVTVVNNLDGSMTITGPADGTTLEISVSNNLYVTTTTEGNYYVESSGGVSSNNALNGRLEATIPAADTDILVVQRGSAEDGYYLKAGYQGTIAIEFTDDTLPISVLIDKVYVSPTGTTCA